VSNPEFPSAYQPDPRRNGRPGGAPDGRRDRAGRGDGAGSGGDNGYGGYQPGGNGYEADNGWGRPAGNGRGAGGDGRQARRAGQPGGNGSQNGRAGRGTSASRDPYAAARARYAARVGAGAAAAGQPGAGRAGTGYRDAGYDGDGHGPNGYDDTGYGTGLNGTGTGYGPVLPRGRTGQWAPGVRRPGRRSGGGTGGWDGDGGRDPRKGDWWRHWTWKKAATLLAITAGCVAMLGAAGVGIAYAKTPIPNPQQAATQAASTVYFSDGKTTVGKFGSLDRQILTYQQIPPVLRNAVVAAEDKNFWHEGGISPTGILRAAYYDLTSSGGNLQGGSTITQQLVRNYYDNIGTAQTMTRKIKEIFVAQKLAQKYSKVWILTQYMNTVYFGDGAYGVGAAAQVYFGLSPDKLSTMTAAQAAMIAAMIQSPSYYSPNPKDGARYKGLTFRWQYVLSAMNKMGTLSGPQEQAALKKFPPVVQAVNNTWGGYRGYIMNAVQYELEHTYHYSPQKIFNGGLRVVSTFSKKYMDSLYATVKANRTLMRHETPPSPPGGPTVACGPKGCLPSYVHIGALLENPANGAVIAMYSGKNYNHTQWDDALQSRNQVGSSFKPYVLATAVSEGMNVMTSKLNGYSPLWIPPDSTPMTYASLKQPANSAGWYQVSNDEVSNPNRPVSVVEATAMSLNTSYTDLWHRVAVNQSTGQHSVVQMAQNFGVDPQASGLTTMRDEAGTALGQASLTVEEQANMIATLADGGVYHTPHVVKEITDGNSVIQARILQKQVLTPDQAAEVDYAMSFDMSPLGTANGLGLTNGQTVIAKTGTTNLAQSAFFLGATQRYAMAVGMFVSDPRCKFGPSICQSTSALAYTPPAGLQTLYGVGGLAGYGGQWPAIIWHDFFMKNFNGLPVQAWPTLPANFGTAWNLAVKLPKLKPHPHPSFTPPCLGFGKKCRPTPGPTVTPTAACQPPFPCPTATPTSTSTLPPAASTRGAGVAAGGVAAGGLVAASVMVALLPARLRRRPGRRRGGQGG
jgi:membrane peptidoglycan carboxypeptidase